MVTLSICQIFVFEKVEIEKRKELLIVFAGLNQNFVGIRKLVIAFVDCDIKNSL